MHQLKSYQNKKGGIYWSCMNEGKHQQNRW